MDLDQITPGVIEQSLRAYRQAGAPPPVLLALHVVSGIPSKTERALRLETYLADMVQNMLAVTRRQTGREMPATQPARKQDWLDEVAADFRLGSQEVEAWSAIYYRYLAAINLSVEELAAAAGVVPQQFRRRLNLGLKLLCAAVQRDELRYATLVSSRVQQRVPPAQALRLVGFEPQTEVLLRLLQDPLGPAIISLEGLGGMGKTSLARQVALMLAGQSGITDIIWVQASAQRTSFYPEPGDFLPPAPTPRAILACIAGRLGQPVDPQMDLATMIQVLQNLLRGSSRLVVIDNLTAENAVGELIAALSLLGWPTHFLLTSRASLRTYPTVALVPVMELDETQALALITAEMQRRGIADALSEQEVGRIYQITGGNPLALTMVAGHIGRFPLEDVLQNAQWGEGHAEGALYGHIFQEAWQRLPASGRRLLQVIADSDSRCPCTLEALSDLLSVPKEPLSESLRDLADDYWLQIVPQGRSLPAYGISNLVRSFVCSRAN